MSNKKVLIAEDEQFIVKLLTWNLEEAGHAVISADDGEKALALIDAEKPDLLLLDLMMPKVDGFDVLNRIKEKGINLPVIIFTNLSQEIDHEKCLEMGAKEYFVKSQIQAAEVVDKVNTYLSEGS